MTHVLPNPLWGVWLPAPGQLLPPLPPCCPGRGNRCQASCSRRPLPAPGTVHPGRALLGRDVSWRKWHPGWPLWGPVLLLGSKRF